MRSRSNETYRQTLYGHAWNHWLGGRYTERISTAVRRRLVDPIVGNTGALLRVTPFASFYANLSKRNGLESYVRNLVEMWAKKGGSYAE